MLAHSLKGELSCEACSSELEVLRDTRGKAGRRSRGEGGNPSARVRRGKDSLRRECCNESQKMKKK